MQMAEYVCDTNKCILTNMLIVVRLQWRMKQNS
jgi:transcription initiation factor TFIIIB Brf1 subunit/transcription initiation factor TFIIB